jgi:hypothetical protein
MIAESKEVAGAAEGKYLRGHIVLYTPHLVGVQIDSPYMYFQGFAFRGVEDKYPLEPISVLADIYRLLKNIDQNIDRFSSMYLILQEELAALEQIEDESIVNEISKSLHLWFFKAISSRTDVEHLFRYSAQHLLDIFAAYTTDKRKIYLPG